MLRRVTFAMLVAGFLLALSTGTAGAAVHPGGPIGVPNSSTETDPVIVDVYPNPATYGDEGEFVTVRLPPGTNASRIRLADDHATVSLPANEAAPLDRTRTLTFSTAPERTTNLTDRSVRGLSSRIQLANDGDRVRLRYEGRVVDSVAYERAPEAEVYNAREGRWRALGATEQPVVEASTGTIEAFVLPDEPDRAVELLRGASDRILLAGYTISSERVVRALANATDRGVRVEVLAEASPAGGLSERAAAMLDRLVRAGVTVQVIGGERARYSFHHAKYAVVDGRALVTTENWKPAGTGGQSSRGWSVISDQEHIVAGLADVFRADSGWTDAIRWQDYDPETVEPEAASNDLPSEFAAESFDVDRAELVLAPDNAEGRMLELIHDAEESIVVEQVHVGDRGFPFLQAVLDAARRGVEVRILLSSAWYVEEENRDLQAWIEEQAGADDLPLEVRLADPAGDFEKIHAKGLVVDDSVVVGSINWNNNSVRENREVAVIVHDADVAAYFRSVFDADWQDSGEQGWRIPVVLALFSILGVGATLVIAARIVDRDPPATTVPRQ